MGPKKKKGKQGEIAMHSPSLIRRVALLFAALPVLALLPILYGSPAPVQAAEPAAFETERILDLAYYDGPDAHAVRHKLDLYLPKGKKGFPLLFFIHGGAWVEGSKNQFGVYSALARTFNKNGIGMVCPNYRLSPKVQHPEHARDVARAFAWTYRNIGKYGGNKDEIFVAGHSAGGHLCALLATDEQYLKEQGLTTRAIRGAIPVSGLFIIPKMRFFDTAFGRDPKMHDHASPINHVSPNDPPFLVIFGENDIPSCDRPQAEAFCNVCRKQQVPIEFLEVPHRNHVSILVNAVRDNDPVSRAILEFIARRARADANHGDAGRSASP
jgi:acetyl esterase/lipase